MILGLKLGRRLLAAVGFANDTFVFRDSRYVGARRTLARAIPTYLRQLFEQTSPSVIYVFAPSQGESTTEQLVRLLEDEAAARSIAVKTLSKMDLHGAFGLLPIKSRAELLQAMTSLWPELANEPDARKTPLAEAGAAALVGDLREAWPPV